MTDESEDLVVVAEFMPKLGASYDRAVRLVPRLFDEHWRHAELRRGALARCIKTQPKFLNYHGWPEILAMHVLSLLDEMAESRAKRISERPRVARIARARRPLMRREPPPAFPGRFQL
jgi:hypothetical protein